MAVPEVLDTTSDPGTDRLHVLAIDDDETNLALIRSILSDYRVTTVAGPLEALEAVRTGMRPDLIVCDVTMPEMTGFELHGRLREVASVRSAPFIYLTALDQPEDVRTGMGLGADDYLTKPYAPGELRTAVASRLARAAALRAEEAEAWQVVTLGGLDVRIGDRRIAWESRRSSELFLFLLEAGDAGVAPDVVRREMWSQAPHGNQLHALVSRLRSTLGDVAAVDSEDDRLRITGIGTVTWDVANFERVAAEALATRDVAAVFAAIGFYGGPFLPGADGPWVDRTRARLDSTAIELHETAVELSHGSQRAVAEHRLEAFLDVS